MKATTITVVQRPMLLTFNASGRSYPLTSAEAQRLLDSARVISATRNRVVLGGHNTADPRQRSTLHAATLGGGPTFILEDKGGQ